MNLPKVRIRTAETGWATQLELDGQPLTSVTDLSFEVHAEEGPAKLTLTMYAEVDVEGPVEVTREPSR